MFLIYIKYLAVRGIGHAPHCGDDREGSWVLIGSWLPGNWVIQEGAVAAAEERL